MKRLSDVSKATGPWLWENWVINSKNLSLKILIFVKTSSKLSNSTVNFKLVIVPAGGQATETYDNKSMDLWLPPTATDSSVTMGCNQNKNNWKIYQGRKGRKRKENC